MTALYRLILWPGVKTGKAFVRNIRRIAQLTRSRDSSFMERERQRQSYMGKANDRDSDSELENQAAKRKGSRGKLAVSSRTHS